MTTTYAGTGYNTPREATRAAVIDWITATGQNGTPEQCVSDVRENLQNYADELAELVSRDEWEIPNVPDAGDPEVVVELLLDFLEEFETE